MFARGGDSAASVAQRNYTLWGRLFESRPNDVNVLIPYAQFLNEQDDNEKSEEMFKRCLEIDKNDVRGLLGFAKLLEEQDRLRAARHGEACGLYERAFELDVKRAELATNDRYLSASALGYAIDVADTAAMFQAVTAHCYADNTSFFRWTRRICATEASIRARFQVKKKQKQRCV
eukprot:647004-Rhodomonas_salina.1